MLQCYIQSYEATNIVWEASHIVETFMSSLVDDCVETECIHVDYKQMTLVVFSPVLIIAL